MSRSSGQVTHVLLTRSRLCPRPKPGSSLHLHVLGTPPAFVLSQDQTLREELHKELSGILLDLLRPRTLPRTSAEQTWVSPWQMKPSHPRLPAQLPTSESSMYTESSRSARRVNLGTVVRVFSEEPIDGVEPGHTLGHWIAEVRMLLSFQRPPHLREGDSLTWRAGSTAGSRADG